MDQIGQWVSENRDRMVHDLMCIVRVPSISESSEQFPPFGRGCRDVLDEYLTLCARFGYDNP